MLYIIIKFLSLIILKLVFRLKITGSENMPRTGPFIIVANHSSLLDGFVLVSSVKHKITFMSAAYLFRIPYIGIFFRGIGAIPVQDKNNDINSIKQAIKILQAGGILGIFPEGGINHQKNDFSPKAGAAYLAIKTGVPIIPVAIKEVDKVLPAGTKFPRLNEIKVNIRKPIFCSKKVNLNKEILKNTVKSYMKEIY